MLRQSGLLQNVVRHHTLNIGQKMLKFWKETSENLKIGYFLRNLNFNLTI